MPAELTFDSTGPITNRLRKSDSPASTWLGGTDCSPSALRVSDSTTKILVKLVTISSRDGATASTVTNISTDSDWLGLPPPTLTVTDPSLLLVGASPAGADGLAGAEGAAGAVGPAVGAAAEATALAVTPAASRPNRTASRSAD